MFSLLSWCLWNFSDTSSLIYDIGVLCLFFDCFWCQPISYTDSSRTRFGLLRFLFSVGLFSILLMMISVAFFLLFVFILLLFPCSQAFFFSNISKTSVPHNFEMCFQLCTAQDIFINISYVHFRVCGLFQSALFHFQILGGCLITFLLLIPSLIPFWLNNISA